MSNKAENLSSKEPFMKKVCILGQGYIGLPWSADVAILGAAYMLSGYYLADRLKIFSTSGFLALLFSAVFVISHMWSESFIDLNSRHFGEPAISILQSSIGIYLIFCLSEAIQKQLQSLRNGLTYVGSNSLFILIFHGFFMGKATSGMMRHFPKFPFISATVGVLAGIIFPLLALEIVKRSALLSNVFFPIKRI